ncbi:SLC13 family permease [Pseudonocardia sp. CA-107938]|uniref:SLC13 family permease n=1 Tax=Pseudonocardia sp. CA-107938 TaxID=3240021 RepID=UPI003D8DDE89
MDVRSVVARIGVLDWIRGGLLLVGLLCVATGLLPAADARANIARIAPILLFLGTVIVLANLARQAKVFDVIATWVAIGGRGNYAALFGLCVVFASLTTTLLNLDTTAVLLTPVLLALAARADIAALPLAMTAIWLANTASLLLPVSNLTNLLAADRVALTAPEFAAHMALPQVASILATAVFLWACYWRRGARGRDRYVPPPRPTLDGPRERALFGISGAACLLFVVAIPFVGDAIGYASAGAALVVVVAFAVLDRRRLRPGLVPWQLLIFVTGLFLVVPTLSRYGLSDVMIALMGTDPGAAGAFRAAAAGAGLSNVLNNLPAYTAGEAVVPDGQVTTLLALLIGTNVGPIVTPWASLATLLCFEACRRHGLRVPALGFVLAGLGLAVVAVGAAVAALLVTA